MSCQFKFIHAHETKVCSFPADFAIHTDKNQNYYHEYVGPDPTQEQWGVNDGA